MTKLDKIYYVANARMPNDKAHAIQIAKMCEALVEYGHKLELIVPNRCGAGEGSMQDFYNLRVPVRITRLPVIDLYRRGPVGFFVSSMMFMCSYVVYLLWKKITASGIIYTVDMDSFSFFALPFLGMPVFTEMHTPKRKSFITRVFFHFTSGVIATNTLIKENIATTFKASKKKFTVEPNGIDVEQFQDSKSKSESRDILKLPLDKKIVLYVGRFYQWKGLEIIPEAVKELPEDICVYMLGGTKEEFQRIVPKESIPENLIFVGVRNYTEIPTWLSAADVLLVLGTKHNEDSYRYTSPMKIFEYMVSGRPIIASNTPAVMEVLSKDEAIFYEPDDAKSLQKEMLYASSHMKDVHKLAQSAKTKADEFSWSNRAKRVTDFIHKIA